VRDSPLARFWEEFRANRVAVVALAVVVVVIVLSLLAPWITPQNPYNMATLRLADARRPPGFVSPGTGITHWLGTDGQGRDMLSAMLYGLRTSLFVGVFSGLVALAVGTTLGLAAAFFGGRIDSLIMRFVDLHAVLPRHPRSRSMLAGRCSDRATGKLIAALVHRAIRLCSPVPFPWRGAPPSGPRTTCRRRR
jgi:ABC-type dipeptide/oligopeptide/nickel transport system permease subunit